MTDTQESPLAVALVQLQAELPKVGKDKTAEVKTDKAKYTYKYADLSGISDALLPLMTKHGLAWTAAPTLTEDGKFVLEYALLHKSGESRGGRYPLPSGGTPQATGSAITYARRYALCSVTGLAPDADDDGQAARQHQERPHAPEKSEADRLRDDIKSLAAKQLPPWDLRKIAQGYRDEYGGREINAETDPEPLRVFLANLRADAARGAA